MRSILQLAVLCFLVAFPAIAQPSDSPLPAVGAISLEDIVTARQRLIELSEQPVLFSAACCKICRKGKACGNSCINRSYRCHKGVGCACDG